MTTHHQDNAWVRALESPPPTTIYTTRTIERTATIDSRDNLPSVSAQSSDPKGPQTNVFADIEDDTWGSVIGIGDCTPEAMTLVANMLSRVAKSRGHGTPVVIRIHPRGPTPATDVPNATSSTTLPLEGPGSVPVEREHEKEGTASDGESSSWSSPPDTAEPATTEQIWAAIRDSKNETAK